jgi:hypothetical protein
MRPFPHLPRLPVSAFEEIEPDEHGNRRWRLKGTKLIGTEQRLDTPIRVQLIERKPMEIPKGGIFYLEYEYSKKN